VDRGVKEKGDKLPYMRERYFAHLQKQKAADREHFLFLFFRFGRQPKNVPVADVSTEGVCMLFVNTLPYGTQYDHHNTQ